MRSRYLLFAFCMVVATAVSIYWMSFRYFENEQLTRATGRLSLYQSSLEAQLGKFSHLTYVMARDPYVKQTAAGGDIKPLNLRFAEFTRRAGIFAMYLMDTDGLTIASSNFDQPINYIGQNYGFRPYFKNALNGQQGRYYAIGATTKLPGYFIADPVRDAAGTVKAVVAIKLDLDALEESWRAAGEQVFLADENGVVLLASNPEWRYQRTQEIALDTLAKIAESRQFMDQSLPALDWLAQDGNRALLEGKSLLHLTADNLPDGWELHYFADYTPATTRSLLVTVLFTIMASSVLIFMQFRQGRRIGAALRRSEAEEAQLREANERLAIEIEDRRTAERRLKRTKDELERAGRLAALGQLSASVTHELGQPIAAMRNHLAAAELSKDGTMKLIPSLETLVNRMEGITRELKFFARTEQDAFEPVDLAKSMQASLALVAPNIARYQVALKFDEPKELISIWGNKLRVEQVMTNVLRNAIDAMQDGEPRELSVTINKGPQQSWFSVEDTGHGFGDSTLEQLQEPFVTTRESGRGMGLGLAISANIIAEHGGVISAENTEHGARFRVAFPNIDDQFSEEAAE